MENPPASCSPDANRDEDPAHVALTNAVHAVLSGQQLESSACKGHSKHKLPSTISFAQLSGLHDVARHWFACDFVGGVGNSMHFAARKVQPSQPQPAAVGRKRPRECDVESLIDASLATLRRRISEGIFERVHSIVVRLYRDLRGSQGELVVQNVGVQLRKLAPDDEFPRVVVFARLHSGIAISTSRLRSALGEAWADGVLSIEESVMGVGDEELALTSEARTSRDLGNLPLLMVFSLSQS